MKSTLPYALRELGPAALLRFGQYRLGLDSGWIRRKTPIYRWEDRPLSYWLKSNFNDDPEAYTTYRVSSAPSLFLPAAGSLRSSLQNVIGAKAEIAVAAADSLTEGTFPLFGLHQAKLGFPPDWHRFAPLFGDGIAPCVPADKHWSEIDLLDLPSDVKLLWEVNRFGWVFTLARAYILSQAPDKFEIFWTLFDSWRAENPPNLGLNWYSGQEVSIRMIALIFAFYVMQAEYAKHPQRVADTAQAIGVHAARIPPTMSYAIAQGNNHLLVEAVGLYTVGLLFPEFRFAGRWHKLGRRWLIHALQEQVFQDGGYIQHSVNYHRMALQAALWAARLAELHGEPLSRQSLNQIENMVAWLGAVCDPECGAAPNFGPNDGAEILPFSMLPFDDHRPTIQAGSWMIHKAPTFEPGEWDEWSLWLGVLGDDNLSRRPASVRALPVSGVYPLVGKASRGFFRAAQFETRPGHADQMHLDLWFGPLNIAKDAGTYLYNAEAPWDNALSGAMYHNTILVDASEAMIRAGRFLWLNWNQATILGHWRTAEGGLGLISAERFGDLARQVIHRRTVIHAGDDLWVILDDLQGEGEHRIDLNWLLPDLPWKYQERTLLMRSPFGDVQLSVEGGAQQLYRAGVHIHGDGPDISHETLGWSSPTYAIKNPALHLVTRWETKLPMRTQSLWSWLGSDKDALEIGWSERSDRGLPISWVRYEDQFLEINDAYSVDSSGIRRAG